MTMNGQPAELHRPIPTLARLPRPVYARAESLRAGSWTSRHRHAWVQLSYAISGVLGVHTAEGSFFAPPQRAIWIPAQLEHEVVTSTRAEMRSLYIRGDACAWAPTRCRVLEVTPLARELIKSFCELPVDYPEGDSAESRLLRLCQALIDEPTQSLTMGDWAQRLGTSEKTLSRLFQRETGMNYRLWRQRQRLLASLNALEAGDSVTGAALDSGYDSTSAYIAAFKGLFGFTPGELFRQR
ncbi:TPA: AraC family transcriptional regulator [Pseudomonas aeruginosa]